MDSQAPVPSPPVSTVACSAASTVQSPTTINSNTFPFVEAAARPVLAEPLHGGKETGHSTSAHPSAVPPPRELNNAMTLKAICSDSSIGTKTLEESAATWIAFHSESGVVANRVSSPSETKTPTSASHLYRGTKRTHEGVSPSSRVAKRKTDMSNVATEPEQTHTNVVAKKRFISNIQPEGAQYMPGSAINKPKFSLADILAGIETSPQYAADPATPPKPTTTPVKIMHPTPLEPKQCTTPIAPLRSAIPARDPTSTPVKKKDKSKATKKVETLQPKKMSINKKFARAAGVKLSKAKQAADTHMQLAHTATKLTSKQIADRKAARKRTMLVPSDQQ